MASPDPSHTHAGVVRRYLAALHAGDSAAIVRLFSPAGEVVSPFLGRMPAADFFAKLAAASRRSDIEVLDVLIGTTAAPRAAAYLRYHWTLRDGTVVVFDCCDVFDFAQEPAEESEPRIGCLTIFYDTAPLRAEVADNLAVAAADELGSL
jgi:ketosteroid isomerase-like protein